MDIGFLPFEIETNYDLPSLGYILAPGKCGPRFIFVYVPKTFTISHISVGFKSTLNDTKS